MVSTVIFSLLLLKSFAICSGFDEGSPDGNDPLQLARTMASRGITLASVKRQKFYLVTKPVDVSISFLWPASPL